MQSLKGGRLLDRVAYCMRKPCKTTDILDASITVCDTFPYNPDSKTAPETALRWAEWGNNGKKHKPEVIERDNTPFAVTITDLHHRSEGGRAYKVVDADMRRFDLREDQVMEVMRDVGIMPGGRINGKFVWGILGSQMRLVLVGGELHRSMVQGADNKKEFEAAQKSGLHPTEASLRPGHVYRKKDKSLHLFLGKFKHRYAAKPVFAFVQMPVKDERDDDDLENYQNDSDQSDHRKQWLAHRKKENEIYARWESLTWRERCDHEWKTKWELYRGPNDPDYVHYPNMVLMSSPKFEADVGEVDEVFFFEIKDNDKHQHRIVDGLGNDILDREFKKAHPHEKGYLAVGDVWQSHAWPDRDDNTARMTATWRFAKKEFHDSIEWV